MTDIKKPNEADSSQQLDERLMELTALFEISRSLSSSLSLQAILENLLRIPMGHMLINRGIVLLKKEQEQGFVVEGLKGLPHHLMGKFLQIDTPPPHAVLLKEMDEDLHWIDFFREFKIELLLPLISSQGTIGVVGFGNKIGDKQYTEREIEFLNSISNIAATAVVNGMVAEESQEVNRRLDRKVQQLNTIFDISRELNATLDQRKIGSLLSFAVMGELLVNRCIVFTKRNSKMEVLVTKGLDSVPDFDFDLCEITNPLILEDTERFAEFQKLGIAVLMPMRVQEETRGLLAIGSKISGGEFDDEDLEFLKTLGNQAMTSLENARLFEETLEKQRMEEELNLARNIQQGLLPSELPKLTSYDIAALNIPSKQVGGDYYDVITVSESLYGIAIADVSGKGAGAALLVANLQASLQALVSGGMEIGEMVSRINNLIYRNTSMDRYITFFYGQLDIKNYTFTYCNAGHNPPYKIGRDGKEIELIAGGLVLGMMDNIKYETATVTLEPGDRIVMFTDGITESMNDKEEEFGEERVKDLIKKNPGFSVQKLMEKICTDARNFSGGAPQADDITLVVMKVKS